MWENQLLAEVCSTIV